MSKATVTKAHRLLVAEAWEGDHLLSGYVRDWVNGKPELRRNVGVEETLRSLDRIAKALADAELRGAEGNAGASDPLDVLGYEDGVEVCEQQKGWLVVTGIDGESFNPAALFFDRGRAEQYCQLEHDGGTGEMEPVAFDPAVVEAVIIGDRIVCANDYTLDHDSLRALVEAKLLPPPPSSEAK